MISGEHGIGITKLEYLTDAELQPFADYKGRIDPEGRFNRGKLLRDAQLPADMTGAYTPSFSLIGHESLILEQSAIGGIADSIKDCLRCGKCKPVCATHVPRANLLYSPRNKILAASLLIEAFLYEEQTRRGVSLRHFDEFSDVADHCTVCHKCANPCPVDIDFGDVSIAMRNLLTDDGHRKFKLGTAAAMFFLNATDPTTIKLTRKVMIDWGYKAQRLVHRLAGKAGAVTAQTLRPPATVGKPTLKAQVIHFINKPMPGGLPKRTSRALLDIEDDAIVPIIRDPARVNDDSEAVFYFPGCGSERLFSQVGLATQAMLYHVGAQTVLPPGYLCCGYPQTAAGNHAEGQKITTANRVLFHRVANTLNYLDIKTVIVSCGTCMDQLRKYEFDRIFPGCRLLDIHEYLMEKGVRLEGAGGVRYMYHDPCHTPMKTYAPLKVVNELMGKRRGAERSLLRGVGHARRDPSGHLHAGPLPQGRGNAQRRGPAARGGLRWRGEGADVLSFMPAGAVALRRRCGHQGRLHRRGDREATCSGPTGWPTTWPRPMPAASSACWCRRQPIRCLPQPPSEVGLRGASRVPRNKSASWTGVNEFRRLGAAGLLDPVHPCSHRMVVGGGCVAHDEW